jgi:hypothetical protein
MAFSEMTFGDWEKLAVLSAKTGLGVLSNVLSEGMCRARRERGFCADEYRHNTLNMKAISSFMKYEKFNVYNFLINL